MDYRMSNWCERACSYIKYKPDRKAAAEELSAHIEDKYEALVASGMPRTEAQAASVVAMGDAEEVGRALAKAHSPFFGYMLSVTKVLLCITVICAAFSIFGARDRIGMYKQNAEAIAGVESNYSDEYKDISSEGYSSRWIRTLFLEPDCIAKSDGYTFTVARIAEWYCEYESEESSSEEHLFYLTIKATHPLPWAGFPEAVRWFTAIDSLGNVYGNMWSRNYSYDKTLTGNPFSRTVFTYRYEMWLSYYVPGAEWIELQYDRDGRDITLRIDLTGKE